jgi:PTH2 family peptidyl-tRNA hydrolase
MRRGKMCTQAAHASMKVILDQSVTLPNSDVLHISMNPEMKDWLTDTFTKICVYVNSEEELLSLYESALEAGILCSLIQDKGLTEFGGVPTYTAVAIGPDESDRIDEITGDLKLL